MERFLNDWLKEVFLEPEEVLLCKEKVADVQIEKVSGQFQIEVKTLRDEFKAWLSKRPVTQRGLKVKTKLLPNDERLSIKWKFSSSLKELLGEDLVKQYCSLVLEEDFECKVKFLEDSSIKNLIVCKKQKSLGTLGADTVQLETIVFDGLDALRDPAVWQWLSSIRCYAYSFKLNTCFSEEKVLKLPEIESETPRPAKAVSQRSVQCGRGEVQKVFIDNTLEVHNLEQWKEVAFLIAKNGACYFLKELQFRDVESDLVGTLREQTTEKVAEWLVLHDYACKPEELYDDCYLTIVEGL